MTTAANPPSTLSTTFLSVSANKVALSDQGTAVSPGGATARAPKLHRAAGAGQRPRCFAAAVDDAVLEWVARVARARRASHRARTHHVDDAIAAHGHRIQVRSRRNLVVVDHAADRHVG